MEISVDLLPEVPARHHVNTMYALVTGF